MVFYFTSGFSQELGRRHSEGILLISPFGPVRSIPLSPSFIARSFRSEGAVLSGSTSSMKQGRR